MKIRYLSLIILVLLTLLVVLYLVLSGEKQPQSLDEAAVLKSQEQYGRTQKDAPKFQEQEKEKKSQEHKKSVTRDDVDGIEKVLMFMGYLHSGHTIMVAMVDAHPNIVIAPAYDILKKWGSNETSDKYQMCSAIVGLSVNENPTREAFKGYTFTVPSQWQGNFLKLKVIGSGTVSDYNDNIFAKERSVNALKKTLPEIEQMIGTPVMIHVVRNPFDMIATHVLLDKNGSYLAKHRWDSDKHKQANFSVPTKSMLHHVDVVRKRASGILAIQREPEWNSRLLEIHNVDFVNNPKAVLQKICDFLDIDCPQDYLEACDSVAFKTLSKSRYSIHWQPEVIEAVNKLIKDHPFFSRYSFDCDC